MKQFFVLIISLLLIIVLILWIGPANIFNALKTANKELILIAILIHLLAVGVRSLRWGFIIKKPFKFKDNYIVKTIGLFAGNFSPMRTAGEVLNAVAGKKINKISLSEGLSAGLTERFFDLAIIGILLILSSLWIENIRYLSILGAFLSLAIVALIYLINWREDSSIRVYKKIHALLCKLPIRKNTLDNMQDKFIEGLKGMAQHANAFTTGRNLFVTLLLSCMAWLMECVRLFVVFKAFNVEIGFASIVVIFLLANFIGVISALPGGIGSIEISLTGLFMIFGVPEALAGSIALVDRLVSFWIVTLLGVIFSSYYAKDILGEIRKYTLDLQVIEKES